MNKHNLSLEDWVEFNVLYPLCFILGCALILFVLGGLAAVYCAFPVGSARCGLEVVEGYSWPHYLDFLLIALTVFMSFLACGFCFFMYYIIREERKAMFLD